jgi:hypothetical protein
MKILKIAFILLIAASFSGELFAQDGIFSNGNSFKKSRIAATVQPVFLTEADDFILFFRGRYGLSSYRDLSVKLGMLGESVFIGGHLEEPHLKSDEYPIMTFFQYGVQYWNDLGLKASYNIRYQVNEFNIYTGLLYQPFFGDSSLHPFLIPLGISYQPQEIDGLFFIELNGGLNNDATALQNVQFGVRLNLGSFN